MNIVVERCGVCGALVDQEDLFCANCGTEIPDNRATEGKRLELSAKNYQCRGCGATMSYDASAQTLKCPFCGSTDLSEDDSRGILAPDVVLPFVISREDAQRRLVDWLGSGFWHPGDLKTAAVVTELRKVFVPFWVVATEVSTHWTADTDRTPPGARASWYPISGYSRYRYENVWIPACAGLPTELVHQVLPFDTSTGVPPDKVELEDVTVEQFALSRRYARPLIQSAVEFLESNRIQGETAGSERNVHVNVLTDGATSTPALAPLFVMAYRYNERVYRYVVNGQTGATAGTAPFSYGKLGLIVALVVVVLLIIVLLAGGFS